MNDSKGSAKAQKVFSVKGIWELLMERDIRDVTIYQEKEHGVVVILECDENVFFILIPDGSGNCTVKLHSWLSTSQITWSTTAEIMRIAAVIQKAVGVWDGNGLSNLRVDLFGQGAQITGMSLENHMRTHLIKMIFGDRERTARESFL